MKKLLLSSLLAMIGGFAHGQCTPDPQYADSTFGVWPDTTTNFAPAALGMPYSQQMDIIIPSNAGEVDPNYAVFEIDSVQFLNIEGLPPGISVACASQTVNTCTFLPEQLGCGVIQGTPTEVGVYELDLNVIAFISLGTSQLPVTYSFPGYRIIVAEGSSVPELSGHGLAAVRNVPNPFAGRTAFEFSLGRPSEVEIKIYNLLGEELWKQRVNAKAGLNKIPFESGGLPEGVYLYKVESGKETFTGRMVLHR